MIDPGLKYIPIVFAIILIVKSVIKIYKIKYLTNNFISKQAVILFCEKIYHSESYNYKIEVEFMDELNLIKKVSLEALIYYDVKIGDKIWIKYKKNDTLLKVRYIQSNNEPILEHIITIGGAILLIFTTFLFFK